MGVRHGYIAPSRRIRGIPGEGLGGRRIQKHVGAGQVIKLFLFLGKYMLLSNTNTENLAAVIHDTDNEYSSTRTRHYASIGCRQREEFRRRKNPTPLWNGKTPLRRHNVGVLR